MIALELNVETSFAQRALCVDDYIRVVMLRYALMITLELNVETSFAQRALCVDDYIRVEC